MKRKISALFAGTVLAAAVCGYSVQAMTYSYDRGGEIFYFDENTYFDDLTEEEKEKLSDWHKEEMRNELAYLECYGVTYDENCDALYYQGKKVRWLMDQQFEGTYKAIQMPEGEIDLYTVREEDYRLTGVRIASQEEYDQQTIQMEMMKAANKRVECFAEENGSVLHTFTYDEETVIQGCGESAEDMAVVTEGVISDSGKMDSAVETTAEEAQGTSESEDNGASKRKTQEYKQNGIGQKVKTGSWMWQGKEVYLLLDEDGSFYQNGSKEAKENKIYLIVKRNEDNSICDVKQITIEEAMVILAERKIQ